MEYPRRRVSPSSSIETNVDSRPGVPTPDAYGKAAAEEVETALCPADEGLIGMFVRPQRSAPRISFTNPTARRCCNSKVRFPPVVLVAT
jgi:hypothetical protein